MRSAKEKVILCQNCACYHAFYREGIVDFWKEEKGICSERKKVVEENDTCDFGKPPYPIVNDGIRLAIGRRNISKRLNGFLMKSVFNSGTDG